jgi:hypothetical protein
MDREKLIELRPEINGILTNELNALERFQNEVLRPIIKFQHDLILAYISSNKQFQSLLTVKGPRLEFQEKLKLFIGKQSDIKNKLIGVVIGLLTNAELKFYLDNSNDLNKRIHQMICQRISDTVY